MKRCLILVVLTLSLVSAGVAQSGVTVVQRNGYWEITNNSDEVATFVFSQPSGVAFYGEPFTLRPGQGNSVGTSSEPYKWFACKGTSAPIDPQTNKSPRYDATSYVCK